MDTLTKDCAKGFDTIFIATRSIRADHVMGEFDPESSFDMPPFAMQHCGSGFDDLLAGE